MIGILLFDVLCFAADRGNAGIRAIDFDKEFDLLPAAVRTDVVSRKREELDVGEVLGRLEDAGDLEAPSVESWMVVVAARPEKP